MNYSIQARITPKTAVKLLISNDIDLETGLSTADAEEILYELYSTSVEELLQVIDSIKPIKQIEVSTLPQFGSLETLVRVPKTLISLGYDCLSYKQLGFFLKHDPNAKAAANSKFGETHGKGASQLGYACLSNNRVCFSALSSAICAVDEEKQHYLTALLCLRIPIIQTLLHRAKDGIINGFEPMSTLQHSTKMRRAICIRMILKELAQINNSELSIRINNIVWETEEDKPKC